LTAILSQLKFSFSLGKKITFFIIKSTLFFLFFKIVIYSDYSKNEITVIINQTQIEDSLKKNLIKDFYTLYQDNTIYRIIEKPIPLNDTLIYYLSCNLPLCAKLINISRDKKYYYIEEKKDRIFQAADREELIGEIIHLQNKHGKILFYGKGKVKFGFHYYDFIGYMKVKYWLENDQTIFQSEISVYPSNYFARSILKMFLKIEFSGFVDKKIDNIYKTISKTALKLTNKQYIFYRAIRSDSISKKYNITEDDTKKIKYVLKQIRGE